METIASYPEHEKLKSVAEKSQTCGEFLDWLSNETGLVLCEFDDESQRSFPTFRSTKSLLAEFFGIDQQKLEAEKVAMLDELRRGAA